MKTKIKLDLDDLSVDSFDTTRPAAERGTVFGEQCSCGGTCPGQATCDQTCPQTCDDFTCVESCDGTCAGWTCITRCLDTCLCP